MTHLPGYSDRISHALAFAAKHGAMRTRPGGSITWPTRPASTAVILARYGCDELTIVAGILAVLLNDADDFARRQLEPRIEAKFGERVIEVVRQTLEQRHDARGKERSWEASRLDFVAGLALADQRALDICAAREIHVCGNMLTDVRRLGAEYLAGYGTGGPAEVVRCLGEVISALEQHPVGPHPGMVTELRDLVSRLSASLSDGA